MTTTRRQVTIKKIACAIKGFETLYMVGRADVMFIKTLETRRVGGWGLSNGVITLIGRGYVVVTVVVELLN